ncbi:MAG: membrane protein insertase YidC [Thermosynechococcaceae cyanobacterium]
MDFGVGFLSNNVMLPILDFFYGIVPSYGLAIVALTLVIRFALYPLSAGQIRNMRRMQKVQPIMQKRQKEIQERYKNDPAKMQEEQAKLIQEFGNPLAGCLPLLVQMPVLFALFATLRGSPFSDVKYTVNLQIVPQAQIEQIQPQPLTTAPQNIYVSDGIHYPMLAIVPQGNQLAVGSSANLAFQSVTGKPLETLLQEYSTSGLQPHWQAMKGADRIHLDEAGHLKALQPGDVTLQGVIPGLASKTGFLFIKALGDIGVIDSDLTAADGSINFNAIHWDVLVLILGFGLSLYANQRLSGQSSASNQQQQAMNKFLPIIFSGMFIFVPLPSGVLLYMLIANIFQTIQSFILSKEPLPENLQKIVDEEQKRSKPIAKDASLPFEPNRPKKKPSN